MTICKNCGVDSPNPLFCTSCQAPLSPEARRVMKLSMEQRLAKQGMETAKKMRRREVNG